MGIEQRIEMLEEANELLEQAIEMIDYALKGTSEYSHANSYILPHLRSWTGMGGRGDTGVLGYVEYLEEDSY